MALRVVLIGATGSVGTSVLDICRRFPERFELVALAARTNADALLELAREFGVRCACLHAPSRETCRRFADAGVDLESGSSGLCALASRCDADHVVFASSGTDAIPALQRALAADKDVSLANKESVVAAGPWVMPLVRRKDQLRPVDSEHSAIWQCLRDEPERCVAKIYLTASGGPFRDWPIERMRGIRPEDALRHPVWSMGAKITVDSATLMNKGIECIEAMQLFHLRADQVGALVHPRSQVHGLVAFTDATMKLLFSRPDMRLPAAAALAWPDRLPLAAEPSLAIPPVAEWALQFTEPDTDRFPCLNLALEAGRRGGAYPPLLIGADAFAVNAFLEERISFLEIYCIIENVLERYAGGAPVTLEDAVDLISQGERMAKEICSEQNGGWKINR